MKYEHNMIQDLMPLVADGAASEESRAAVMAHVAECAECAAVWREMQPEITAFQENAENAVPDPETVRYTAAAKRVRRRHGLRALLIVCGVLLLAAAGWYTVLWRDGCRLTPESAVVAEIAERNSGYLNDIEPWHDPSNTVELFSTVRTADRKFALTAALERNASGKPLVIHFCETDRREPYNSGLWSSHTSVYFYLEHEEQQPIYADIFGCSNNHFEEPLWGFCYTTDSAVKTVELTAGGETWTMEPVNGAAVADCSNYKALPYSNNMLPENDAFVHGKAYDADGNVLYVREDGNWVKAE